MSTDQLNKLSEKLLLYVKLEKDTSLIQLELKNLPSSVFKSCLVDDNRKKAFWINIYNAFFLILRKDRGVEKPDIYRKRLFVLAGRKISLDDVEHGILRKYRYKYSLGFFANVMTSRFIKEHTVDVLDYRIHFALNCGALSCPPIALYNLENVDTQLDVATQSFLEGESNIDSQNKTISTTALFKWFYADFGGRKGMNKIFLEQLNKDVSDYRIIYREYSWEDSLDNFIPDN